MSQRARVLRCCSCRLFQAQQVTKSRKWTCRACGEKQSFLRAYGEGSGADCRRHVQKLNLLQGQLSEESLRTLEGGAPDGAASGQPSRLQPQASQSRWQKYLEGDSEGQTWAGGMCQEPGAACPEFSRKSPPCTETPAGLWPERLAGLFQTGEDFDEDLL
ncbi:MRN complex-interacting protein isoform X2 [Sorex araneus]|uniref:MRN complex-interacting protein isoform X2 n=1 Tax=Sorex araneus TaxID=42254 RepID=UPI002433ACC1|nr:MRN complex-interacting protein isoform X2 [Sorex araneus]